MVSMLDFVSGSSSLSGNLPRPIDRTLQQVSEGERGGSGRRSASGAQETEVIPGTNYGGLGDATNCLHEDILLAVKTRREEQTE